MGLVFFSILLSAWSKTHTSTNFVYKDKFEHSVLHYEQYIYNYYYTRAVQEYQTFAALNTVLNKDQSRLFKKKKAVKEGAAEKREYTPIWKGPLNKYP